VTSDDVERDVRRAAAEWVFIREVETVDKTEHAVKMRLHVDTDCFVQVYANVQKGLVSYTLVLNRYRILGRDCEGGIWHQHAHSAPDQHDFSPEGQRAVSLDEFLSEAQHVLQEEGLL
jgi:hypothetical protein